MHAPLFSIVMPSFNQGAFIGAAIESIIAQDADRVELIVMDGGSTDQTQSVLQQYESRLPLRWISRPDEGLYDALNQAIALSRGEWIGWLNTDDIYPPGTLRLATALSQQNDIEVISGDAELFLSTGSDDLVIISKFQHYRADRFVANVENLATTHLNACFLRRPLLDKIGRFDVRYKVAADRDYLLRLMRLAPRNKHTGTVTCRYRSHPGSLTMGIVNAKNTGTDLASDSPAWLELRQICLEHMVDPRTPDAARRWCRRTWAGIVANQAVRDLASKDPSGAGRNLRDGFRHGGLGFGVHFARNALRFGLRGITGSPARAA